MSASSVTQSIRKTPIFTPYVVMWSTLGLIAVGLLSVIVVAPDLLDDLKPASVYADPQTNQGQRAAARLAADLNSLKGSVAQIQLDLSRVKTAVAVNEEQHKTLATQVATFSTTNITHSPSIAADGAATTAPRQNETMELPSAAGQAPAAAGPNPIRVPKVINADATAASSLETGSVAQPIAAAASAPISFGPAVVKPAPKPIGIKVSSGTSVDSLRLSWSLLAEQHGATLGSLQPRFVTGGDAQNPSYDLVAGPIKTKADAVKVCKALVAQGATCAVSIYAGDTL